MILLVQTAILGYGPLKSLVGDEWASWEREMDLMFFRSCKLSSPKINNLSWTSRVFCGHLSILNRIRGDTELILCLFFVKRKVRPYDHSCKYFLEGVSFWKYGSSNRSTSPLPFKTRLCGINEFISTESADKINKSRHLEIKKWKSWTEISMAPRARGRNPFQKVTIRWNLAVRYYTLWLLGDLNHSRNTARKFCRRAPSVGNTLCSSYKMDGRSASRNYTYWSKAVCTYEKEQINIRSSTFAPADESIFLGRKVALSKQTLSTQN